MNLLLTKPQEKTLSNWWTLSCYLSLLPFAFLMFHDGWYGIGWGKLGWPLITIGVLIGSICSVYVAWKGSWWQRLGVLPPLLFFSNVWLSNLVGMF